MIGAALASTAVGAISANSAAKKQEGAAKNQLALQERVYDETVERFEPYAADGMDYQNALRFELLGGDAPMIGATAPAITEEQYSVEGQGGSIHDRTGQMVYDVAPQSGTRFSVAGQQFDSRDAAEQYAAANPQGGQQYGGFEMSAGNQFALTQANDAIQSSAAARGGLFRGSVGNALAQNTVGMANQFRDNYLNRLSMGAQSGQAAAGNQANAGANFAAGGAQAYGNIGNAQSAGAIGVGNALQGGLNQGMGIWNYQNQMAQNQPKATPGTGVW